MAERGIDAQQSACKKALHGGSGATMQDVADAAESRSPPSRVTSTRPRPSGPPPEPRSTAAIARLGYEQDLGARSLALGRSPLGRSRDPDARQRDLRRRRAGPAAAARRGRLHAPLRRAPSTRPIQELKQVRALLARGTDALFLIGAGSRPGGVRTAAPDAACPTCSAGLPARRRTPFIGFDNRAAAEKRTPPYLVEIGHRRIGMIAGVGAGNDRARQRAWDGVRPGVARRGLELPAARVLERPLRHRGRRARQCGP